MAEGYGGDSRERTEHGDGKPQVIKGLVLVEPRGAARAFHGQYWAMGPTGPSRGLHSWLEGAQEAVGWEPGLRPTSRGQGCRVILVIQTNYQ